MTEKEAQPQLEEGDDDLDSKLNYKPPPQKSLKELQEMDKDDESLTKYKKTLLGDVPVVAGACAREGRAGPPARQLSCHPQSEAKGYTVRWGRHCLFVLSRVVGCIIKSFLETVRESQVRQTKITHPQGALRISDHNYIAFWSPSAPRFLSVLGVFFN